jgi:hypothetical protein
MIESFMNKTSEEFDDRLARAFRVKLADIQQCFSEIIRKWQSCVARDYSALSGGQNSTVVKQTKRRPSGAAKWGAAALAGFQPVPDVLLVKQHEMKLQPVDMLVLLNLTSYWWYRDEPPYPRTNIIAQRIGISPRTVQRVLKKLEEKGYIERGHWKDRYGKERPAVFFTGLLTKLEHLARTDPWLGPKMRQAAHHESSSTSEEIRLE